MIISTSLDFYIGVINDKCHVTKVKKAELAFGAERCKYQFPVILTSLSLSRLLKDLFKCELSEHCSVTKLACFLQQPYGL